jgi:hypothetical protein
MAQRILAQSKNYRITSEYETVWLKSINDTQIVIGDFYGDPENAVIDVKERWCIVFGAGLIVYYLRKPFQPYQHNCATNQWKEIFRKPDDARFIETVYQVGDNQVRFVADLNDEYAGVYELTLKDLSIQKLL